MPMGPVRPHPKIFYAQEPDPQGSSIACFYTSLGDDLIQKKIPGLHSLTLTCPNWTVVPKTRPSHNT